MNLSERYVTILMETETGVNFTRVRFGLTYLLTYAHRSQWSIGHQRPPAIALCSGLLLSFRTSWSPAVSFFLSHGMEVLWPDKNKIGMVLQDEIGLT